MDLEFSILYFLQGLHQPWLDKLMVAITTLGEEGLIWIVLALAMLCTKKYRTCGIGVAISLVLMLLTGNIFLKHLIMRDRPCWIDTTVELLVASPSSYSFPSGHTFASFVSAVTIFLHHKKEGIVALVLAVLISFSRMYLFVHFPTDVLASVVLGTGIAIGVYFAMKRVKIKSKASNQ